MIVVSLQVIRYVIRYPWRSVSKAVNFGTWSRSFGMLAVSESLHQTLVCDSCPRSSIG